MRLTLKFDAYGNKPDGKWKIFPFSAFHKKFKCAIASMNITLF